jgi:hypothetical protein
MMTGALRPMAPPVSSDTSARSADCGLCSTDSDRFGRVGLQLRTPSCAMPSDDRMLSSVLHTQAAAIMVAALQSHSTAG